MSEGVCCLVGQGGPYSPEGAALGGYGLDGQAHLGLRTAGIYFFPLCHMALNTQR